MLLRDEIMPSSCAIRMPIKAKAKGIPFGNFPRIFQRVYSSWSAPAKIVVAIVRMKRMIFNAIFCLPSG